MPSSIYFIVETAFVASGEINVTTIKRIYSIYTFKPNHLGHSDEAVGSSTKSSLSSGLGRCCRPIPSPDPVGACICDSASPWPRLGSLPAFS